MPEAGWGLKLAFMPAEGPQLLLLKSLQVWA